jgi:hypothetical protein
MHTGVMFLDCPAYIDQHGTARCGLPAAVECRYTLSSNEGPVESAKIRCPRGHWFNAPIEALTERNTGRPHATQHRTQSVPGHTITSLAHWVLMPACSHSPAPTR